MLTKKALAEKIGVARHTVLRWEDVESLLPSPEPTEENFNALVKELGFPKAFYFGVDVDEPSSEVTSFRSQTSMSACERDAALAAGQLGCLIWDWVSAKFNLPEVKIPSLRENPDPETAAQLLRLEWGLGERPISNMIQLLESKGARVFSLSENTSHMNAYSFWRRGNPFVFLNNFKTAECSRFDAAHELAHLVMHRDGAVSGREAEDQANRFASAFLMPRADVIATLPRIINLDQLVTAKARWKVSLAALTYRVHKLNLTTEWRNRDLCIEISKRGYNHNEPKGIEWERSVVWDKVLRELFLEQTTHEDIAQILNIPAREVNDLLFGVIGRATNAPKETKPLSIVGNETAKEGSPDYPKAIA
jgi:Zn-dependent peptidase ImmA (M78 family)